MTLVLSNNSWSEYINQKIMKFILVIYLFINTLYNKMLYRMEDCQIFTDVLKDTNRLKKRVHYDESHNVDDIDDIDYENVELVKTIETEIVKDNDETIKDNEKCNIDEPVSFYEIYDDVMTVDGKNALKIMSIIGGIYAVILPLSLYWY